MALNTTPKLLLSNPTSSLEDDEQSTAYKAKSCRSQSIRGFLSKSNFCRALHPLGTPSQRPSTSRDQICSMFPVLVCRYATTTNLHGGFASVVRSSDGSEHRYFASEDTVSEMIHFASVLFSHSRCRALISSNSSRSTSGVVRKLISRTYSPLARPCGSSHLW